MLSLVKKPAYPKQIVEESNVERVKTWDRDAAMLSLDLTEYPCHLTSEPPMSSASGASDDRSAWTAREWFAECCRLDDLEAPVEQVVAAGEKGRWIARAGLDHAAVIEGTVLIAGSYANRGLYADAVRIMAEEVDGLPLCTDRSQVAGFLGAFASSLGNVGDYVRAIRYYEEAIATLDTTLSDDPVIKGRVFGNYLELLIKLDRAADADAFASIFRETRERIPDDVLKPFRTCYSCVILTLVAVDRTMAAMRTAVPDLAGIEDALTMTEESLRVARDAAPASVALVQVARSLCLLLLARDDPEGEAMLAGSDRGSYADAGSLMVQAVIRWAALELGRSSRPERARRILELVAPSSGIGQGNAPDLRWYVVSAEINEKAGDFAAACVDYRAHLAALERSQATILSLRSEIADVVGHAEEARRQAHRAREKAVALQQRNSELADDHARMTRMARTDPLTAVGNRRALMEVVEQLSAESERDTHLLVVVDIDHFKAVNDLFSHQVGDEVIALVARILDSRIRRADSLFRFGGEEFVVLLKSIASLERVESWRSAIERYDWSTVAAELRVTASFGVSTWQEDEPFDSAFQRADQSLYKAKKTGRNRVVFS